MTLLVVNDSYAKPGFVSKLYDAISGKPFGQRPHGKLFFLAHGLVFLHQPTKVRFACRFGGEHQRQEPLLPPYCGEVLQVIRMVTFYNRSQLIKNPE